MGGSSSKYKVADNPEAAPVVTGRAHTGTDAVKDGSVKSSETMRTNIGEHDDEFRRSATMDKLLAKTQANQMSEQQATNEDDAAASTEEYAYWAVALDEFQPEEAGEMQLLVGDKLVVTPSKADGWVWAMKYDEKGWIPASYISPMQDLVPAVTIASHSPVDDEEALPIQEGEVVGVMGQIDMPDGSSWANVIKAPGFPGSVGPGRIPNSILEYASPAKAMQDFEALHDVELSLIRNETVWVLPVYTDSGWSEVMTVTGAGGLVPSAFLEMDNGEESDDGRSGKTGSSHAPMGSWMKDENGEAEHSSADPMAAERAREASKAAENLAARETELGLQAERIKTEADERIAQAEAARAQSADAAVAAARDAELAIQAAKEAEADAAQRAHKEREAADAAMKAARDAQAAAQEAQDRLHEEQDELRALKAKLDATGVQLNAEQAKAKAMQKQWAAEVAQQKAEAEQKILQAEERTQQQLRERDEELAKLRIEAEQLRAQLNASQVELDSVRVQLEGERLQVHSALAKAKEWERRYFEESRRRRDLHNQMQDMVGTLRVGCRVRPLTSAEKSVGTHNVVDVKDGEMVTVQHHHRDGGTKELKFEFTHVYGPDSSQAEIFNDSEPLMTSVTDGYNVCIFAYGQSGTGKTFTMDGTEAEPGIGPRAMSKLFDVMAENVASGNVKHEAYLSMLEIYNENIRDLLADPNEDDSKRRYDILSDSMLGMYVKGLTSNHVTSADEARAMIKLGNLNRAVGATNLNEHSSRSHMLVTLVVLTTNVHSGAKHVGKLSLVDLAGSERLAKSQTSGAALKETQAINKSLTSLGVVLNALVRKEKHIPYRDSKLTFLLQDSLGGNSKTLMLVTCSPAEVNSTETVNSLTFAMRAKEVYLGKAAVRSYNAPPGGSNPSAMASLPMRSAPQPK